MHEYVKDTDPSPSMCALGYCIWLKEKKHSFAELDDHPWYS